MIYSALRHKQRGYAITITTVVIMVLVAGISMFAAKTHITEQRLTRNVYVAQQSFEAAEAGLEFGLAYVEENHKTIIVDKDDNGYIDAYDKKPLTDVVLGNKARFTVSITNPVVNDFDTIQITAIGTSMDGTTRRSISQLLYRIPYIRDPLPSSLITKGDSTLQGDSIFKNDVFPTTVWTGNNLTLKDNAKIDGKEDTGTDHEGHWWHNGDWNWDWLAGWSWQPKDSSSGTTETLQNDENLSNLNDDEFFETFVSQPQNEMVDKADLIYSNAVSTNYNGILNGIEGKMIWISQVAGTAEIDGNTVIGSPEEPVILIVNGDFKLQGNAIIHGVVIVLNDWDNSGTGSATINGSAIVNGDYTSSDNETITWDMTVNDNLKKLADFTKIPGSWKDY